MKKEEFINELEKLNIEITDEKINQLKLYMDFLIEYNSHTNLTAISNEQDVYLKHFYDSLTIVKAIDLKKVNNLLDIGSGAGFPGMVIKIFFPEISITLIDSNNKKTKFLSQLSKKLNLDVEVINMRVEDYAKTNLNKFDVVTSRAVANLRVLSEISLPLVKKTGLFVPLKGILDDSLEDSLVTIEMLNGKVKDIISFQLFKDAGTRNIVVVEKTKETDISELRTYDKIIKKPLKKNNK